MRQKNQYFTELEQTILDFAEIDAQLNYRKAQNSLRNLISNLDLTSEEQQGLESEIDYLSGMLDKLEQSVVQIAVFGMVGRGKSSVLNALVGKDIFTTGPLHGVTRSVERVDWNIDKKQLQRLTISQSRSQNKIQLLDTPGIDEVNGEQREVLAHSLATKVDLILFVVSGDITQVEYQALSQLREAGKPMLLVFNKIDQYPEADRQIIYQKICDERVKELISPEEIIMVAAAPVELQAIKGIDGKVKVKRVRGKPQIENLKLKIWELLEQEGKSLIALNSMLYANTINEQILQRKLRIRENAANDLIQRGAMIKATATALNPVTAIDLFAGAIIDVALILALSRLYGIPMTQQGAIALLQKIALSMGGIGGSELLATLGLSSLKGLLGISIPVTGGLALAPYLSIAIAQGSVAGVSSYAIGQITKTYLANGASWGEKSPKTVVKDILNSLDEQSILNRIKSELQAKLWK
ncbi:MAG: GTP-binding protein [Xenococcaceae cyanobacterium MO_234.B1]|nr:GTP-binding protein [Xenococcaceae cyanobacterium MO_234.B1]